MPSTPSPSSPSPGVNSVSVGSECSSSGPHTSDNKNTPLSNQTWSHEEDSFRSFVDGNESESIYPHGRVSQRVPSLERTNLKRTNFILDNPVPNNILDFCENRTEREFTHLRYSAVTCDPNHFTEDGFSLRQSHYDPPRRAELFIVMTLRDEDEELFTRSMHAVIKNIADLCQRNKSNTWGNDGWKKVVLCIVSDSQAKMNPGTLFVLTAMGCYQEDALKLKIVERDVTAHVFEYTTQSPVTPSSDIEASAEKGVLPVQIILCIKEKSEIDTRCWAFDAFGPILQPNVCLLLGVGSTPGPASFYHFWKAFNVGGACGKIVALKRQYGANSDVVDVADVVDGEHNAEDVEGNGDSD